MSSQENTPGQPSVTEGFTITDEPMSVAVTRNPRRSLSSARSNKRARGFRAGVGLEGVARRTLGIILLLVTVVLWTGSNFLASVSNLDIYIVVSWLTANQVHFCG
jgi:hypothetical protein